MEMYAKCLVLLSLIIGLITGVRGTPTLTVYPGGYIYPVNTTVYIKCTSSVGECANTTKPYEVFTWRTKLESESNWTLYDVTGSGNIHYTIPTITGSQCQRDYYWSSILVYTINAADINRQINCSVYDRTTQITLRRVVSVLNEVPGDSYFIFSYIGYAALVVICLVTCGWTMTMRNRENK